MATPAHGGPRSRGSARDPNVEVAPNPAGLAFLVGIELSYGFGGSWGLFPQSIPR